MFRPQLRSTTNRKAYAAFLASQVDALNVLTPTYVQRASQIMWRYAMRAVRNKEMPDPGMLDELLSPTVNDLTALAVVSHERGFEVEQDSLPKAIAADSSSIHDRVSALLQRQPTFFKEVQTKYKRKSLELVQGLSDDVADEVRDTLNELIRSGSHVDSAVRELSAKFAALGVSPAKPYRLSTLFKTANQLAYSAGRWQSDRDVDVDEIIWGYEYLTVGDDRVRPQHYALEGVTLPKSDDFWLKFWPPNGWNCRCQAVAILDKGRIKRPPKTDWNGKPLRPDKGFGFNPGKDFGGAPEATRSKRGSYSPSTTTPFKAIGARVKQLLQEGLTSKKIISILEEEMPDAGVNLKTVAYYRNKLKTQ